MQDEEDDEAEVIATRVAGNDRRRGALSSSANKPPRRQSRQEEVPSAAKLRQAQGRNNMQMMSDMESPRSNDSEVFVGLEKELMDQQRGRK